MAKILVVDDDKEIRNVLHVLLAEDCGHDLFEADNARLALDVFAKNPDINIVITDVKMPGTMDGTALAHHFVDHHPSIAVIVMTGHELQSKLPKSIEFLQKPFRLEQIMDAVDKFLRGDPPKPAPHKGHNCG